ncbi:potassium transporter, partial [Halomonas sp. BBD48]|nr:potassium transporter [Halomonas sp. BBD48]
TYYSALELGSGALTAMGVHPQRARRMTRSFIASEKAHEDQLFDTWRDIEEGIHFSPRYGELFMKLEESMGHAMKEDARRTEDEAPAWTPPRDNG